MKIVVTDTLPDEWDTLPDHDNPFVKRAFLHLLETSGSVGPGTGWEPRYVTVWDGKTLVGAAPAYLRTDSYGEYVFDWGWASAAQRAGIRYYPKITVAVPFTPATGPRLLGSARAELLQGLRDLCKAERASGVHVLLCEDDEATLLQQAGYLRRATHQYHFHNRGYASYDDFLAQLRSSARKQLRKERRIEGVTLERKLGGDLTEAEWTRINQLYLHTASRKWGRPYLTREFFSQAKAAVGDMALACLARRDGQIVAMALSFFKGTHIYGRYWGATEEIDGLHFELCYHQLIDHAIATGATLVEAGAQGEHKIKRGFEPAVIHSAHLLMHQGLHEAVGRAIAEETADLQAALPEMRHATPFRRE